MIFEIVASIEQVCNPSLQTCKCHVNMRNANRTWNMTNAGKYERCIEDLFKTFERYVFSYFYMYATLSRRVTHYCVIEDLNLLQTALCL